MRILLDTNVLVSGLLGREGHSGRLLQLWLDDAFELVSSRNQLSELRRVTGYTRIKGRIDSAEVADLLDLILSKALLVEIVQVPTVSADPDDNLILAAAIAGNANLIVSGDKGHMVVLGHVENIPIVTPREAFARLSANDS